VAKVDNTWTCSFHCSRMRFQPKGDRLDFTTATHAFCGAMTYAPLTVAQEGDYRFELSYRLRKGELVFGALGADNEHWWCGHAPWPSSDPELRVASCSVHLKAGDTFRLCVCNGRADGGASAGVLLGLRAFREMPAAAETGGQGK